MRAVQLRQFGGPEELFIGETQAPERNPGQVLVQVHASALNRADLLQRQGKYPPPQGESEILGLEMAGEVIEADKNCKWKVGDKVMGLLAGGGQAEIATVDAGLLMPLPKHMSFAEGAAIPEVFLTAYQTLFLEGNARKGEKVLIHAGASGVGTAAIQLAREWGLSIAVTASPTKHEICTRLGALLAIDYKTRDFEKEVRSWSGGKGVDLILDFIGAPYFPKNIACLSLEGRLIQIAMMGGSIGTDFNLAPLLMKRLQIIGTTLRARSIGYKKDLISKFMKEVYPLLDSGTVTPVIDSVFNWEEIEEAHRLMESNKNQGKIILNIIS